MHSRRTDLLATHNAQLESDARARAERELTAAALEAGILDKASKNARRTVEDLLRALGFSRFSILSSFVMESMFLALLAGAIGCLLALPMNGFSTGTAQTQSFSEVAFSFTLTPAIIMTGMTFAGAMGLIGGLPSTPRGARVPVTPAPRVSPTPCFQARPPGAQPLEAVTELHYAKSIWYHGDTMYGGVLTGRFIAALYSQLGLARGVLGLSQTPP